MRTSLTIILTLLFSLCAKAQETTAADTLAAGSTPRDTGWEKIAGNRWVQSTYIGVPLIVGSITEMKHNKHFRNVRQGTMERHSNGIDNYLEYAPAAVMYAMKLAGVESRSSWSKMLTADVLSAALVVATSQGMKKAGDVQRPDGEDYHSYPSGHTAIAFMTATMLNKEYGYLSPWVGYAAYSTALGVGFMRIKRNRHWTSDVLAGAGIGIMGTEFGYWLADLCFPKEKKSKGYTSRASLDDCDKPHFVSSFFGYFVPISSKNIGNNMRLKTSNGGTAGVEGAYFLNQHIGIGAQISAAHVNYIIEGESHLEDDSYFYSALAGCYLSYPIYQQLSLGARVMGGMNLYPDINSAVKASGDGSGFAALAGLSIGMQAKQHLDFKLGIDYEFLASPISGMRDVHTLVFSGGASIHF